MIVALAPNPSIDRFFRVADEVRVGSIHRPVEVVATAGGKGLNVARVAAALGGDVQAVALLGGHAGRWIADRLRCSYIRTAVVWTTGETRTSLTAADDSTGRPTEFYEHGEPVDPDAWDRFVDSVGHATGASWISVSGSLPPGTPAGAATDLVARARATGARVAVDQHGAALAAALDAAPDLVKVNAAEATELTGEPQPRVAAAALRRLLAARRADIGLDAPTAIVTAGEAGAFVAAPGGVYHGGIDTRGPFPTGSGDAFLAGLLVALDALDPPPATGVPCPPPVAEMHGVAPDDRRLLAAVAAGLGAAAANAEAAGVGRLDGNHARALTGRAAVTPLGPC